MRFVGTLWRLLVGIKDGLVLALMLLFFGLLFAALSARPTASPISQGALLLDLGGSIAEQPAEADPLSVLSGGSALVREYRLRDVVHALNRAAEDDRVKAVALDLDSFLGGGQTALGDVGEAMDRVRRTGKPVVAYATGYTDGSYLLAAHASEVWLNPLGAVLVTGPGGSNLYFKGLLDRLGITANVYRVGTYKAAVEPFTRTDMSAESRQASEALAGALWSDWRRNVAAARPRARIDQFVGAPLDGLAASGGDMAKAALAAGLVDRIGDRTAFGRRMAELVGAQDESIPGSYRAITYDAWVGANPSSDSSGAVGVLTIAGDIVDGEAGPGTAGAESIVGFLRQGISSGNLKALVIRIDSPGGSVTASERIRQAILDAKATGLPVVVSMGSMTASAGYWIATTGDRIFAEPSTITGSIGVFGILPSFQGALAKLGIGADGVKTTSLSGEPDLLRGPSDEANRYMQAGVEQFYRLFISVVAEARKIAPARVNEIAQGRVWDGGSARQLGLVDQFGGLDEAIAEAARRARLDPATTRAFWLEKQPTFFDGFLKALEPTSEPPATDAYSRMAQRPQLLLARAVAEAERLIGGPAIQARCLECGFAATPHAVAPPPRPAWWWPLLAR